MQAVGQAPSAPDFDLAAKQLHRSAV